MVRQVVNGEEEGLDAAVRSGGSLKQVSIA